MVYYDQDIEEKMKLYYIDEACRICNEFRQQSCNSQNNDKYEVCLENKNALYISFANYILKAERNEQDIKSQLQLKTNLLSESNQKLSDCNKDKNFLINDIKDLRVNYNELNANNTNCHTSLIAKTDKIKDLEDLKDQFENEKLDFKSQLELKDEQIDKCKEVDQSLKDEVKRLEDELESEVNKISTRLTQAQSDLSICQKNLGKECKEVDQSLKDEVKRLEDELADVRIDLNQCNSNLTKTNDENLVLNNKISDKVKDLEECSSSLLKVKNQVKALEKKIEELKVEKQNNDEKIEKLTQENAIIVARNETITSYHNKCNKDLQNARSDLITKDERISKLDAEMQILEQDEKNCQLELNEAIKDKMAGYKSSCNLMHERYQNYYDGATSDKSFFDKLIDHFLSRWFSTRYSDTKLIWEESSLKGLLCVWQRDGIVKQNAIIKVKDSLDKEYTLERMCTDQDLIKNFKQDILNPCGDESNIWNYDHD